LIQGLTRNWVVVPVAVTHLLEVPVAVANLVLVPVAVPVAHFLEVPVAVPMKVANLVLVPVAHFLEVADKDLVVDKFRSINRIIAKISRLRGEQ
jgi:hypothetical protein